MPAIRLQGVTKTYARTITAVRDLSLDVGEGEFMVLVGPSGCGKSTTLRLIAGLERPDGGEVRFGERVMNRVAPQDRDVAMVFQDAALYPHMTAYRNMAFPLRIRRTPRAEIERRVRDVARRLGIEEALERRPAELSGGQAQRVALGKAIVRQPAVFLFDEPLSNIDPRRRVALRALIRTTLRESNAPAVYVTHDHEEAMALGDRIAVMHQGAIRQVGPPMEVYRRPADRFVAEFLGSPPMNFLEGRLVRGPEGLQFTDGAGFDVPVAVAPDRAPETVVVGIRPQSLHRNPTSTSIPIPVRIVHLEPLGDRLDVHVQTRRGDAIVAQLPASASVELGEGSLHLDAGTLHLFETGELGRNLTAVG
jgi:multiple sugar transport system ATP-binding protein